MRLAAVEEVLATVAIHPEEDDFGGDEGHLPTDLVDLTSDLQDCLSRTLLLVTKLQSLPALFLLLFARDHLRCFLRPLLLTCFCDRLQLLIVAQTLCLVFLKLRYQIASSTRQLLDLIGLTANQILKLGDLAHPLDQVGQDVNFGTQVETCRVCKISKGFLETWNVGEISYDFLSSEC